MLNEKLSSWIEKIDCIGWLGFVVIFVISYRIMLRSCFKKQGKCGFQPENNCVTQFFGFVLRSKLKWLQGVWLGKMSKNERIPCDFLKILFLLNFLFFVFNKVDCIILKIIKDIISQTFRMFFSNKFNKIYHKKMYASISKLRDSPFPKNKTFQGNIELGHFLNGDVLL